MDDMAAWEQEKKSATDCRPTLASSRHSHAGAWEREERENYLDLQFFGRYLSSIVVHAPSAFLQLHCLGSVAVGNSLYIQPIESAVPFGSNPATVKHTVGGGPGE